MLPQLGQVRPHFAPGPPRVLNATRLPVRYLRTHPGFFSILGNGGVKGTQATPSHVYGLPVRLTCVPSLVRPDGPVGASGSGDAYQRRTPPLGRGSERVVKTLRPACFTGGAVRPSVMEEAAQPSLVVDLPRCRVDLGTKVVTCRIDAETLRRMYGLDPQVNLLFVFEVSPTAMQDTR